MPFYSSINPIKNLNLDVKSAGKKIAICYDFNRDLLRAGC